MHSGRYIQNLKHLQPGSGRNSVIWSAVAAVQIHYSNNDRNKRIARVGHQCSFRSGDASSCYLYCNIANQRYLELLCEK